MPMPAPGCRPCSRLVPATSESLEQYLLNRVAGLQKMNTNCRRTCEANILTQLLCSRQSCNSKRGPMCRSDRLR